MKTENHRILIIDDERPILMTLEALLERHGYQVDIAPTASQGLKLLKSKAPSLVLLDLQLPDAPGLETLDQLRIGIDIDFIRLRKPSVIRLQQVGRIIAQMATIPRK